MDIVGPDLILGKTVIASEPVTPGQPISFVISLANAGRGPATDALLTDIVPSGIVSVSYQSSFPVTPTGDVSYTWRLGDFPGGATGVVTISGWVDIDLAVPVAMENIALATSTNLDIDPSDNRASATLYLDVPIEGLTASNDGPTPLGKVTTLSASVVTGGHVTFSWALGDGSEADGATVEHVYPRMGEYSATVTAQNSFGSAVVSTTVTIVESRYDLRLPLVYKGRGASMPILARR